MADKSKKPTTVETVWKIVEPLAAELGLSIWDVRFVKEGAGWFLRIFIDKPEGVGIEDCVNMSHAVDGPLDEADPISQEYTLEVCSPGIERELTRDAHFKACLGMAVFVRLIRPGADGSREVGGILAGCADGVLTLETEDGGTLAIARKDVSSVHLIDEEE